MNILRLKITLWQPFAVVALLAGCSAQGVSLDGRAGASNGAAVRVVPVTVHADHRKSWMLPQRGRTTLIYASDPSTEDVDVYDYATGKPVGTLTGFAEPGAQCVEANGDVYIANVGNGTVVEYAHGGTKVVATYKPGGDPMGCAVNSKGDLAVTSWEPGQVTVYAGGDPRKGKAHSDTACAEQWPMGYDDNGNLIGVGEEQSVTVCALLAGAKSETTLSADGMTIDFPGGTTWDGRYITLADQEAGGKYVTGINAATLSGSTLIFRGEAILTDTCYSDFADIITPFVVGKKNTPVNDRQGSVVVGANTWCGDEGVTRISFWHYPKGGNPFKYYNVGFEPAGLSVSIGT